MRNASSLLEVMVIVLQVLGIAALGMNRLVDSGRWAKRARFVFAAALVGLGVVGALCGGNGSEFGLFAGGTMTILYIGMTLGGGAIDPTIASRTGSAM